jgi:RNA polymerase sigma-70 factor (ECF subfamily)
MGRSFTRQQFREVFTSTREPVHRFLWRLAGNSHDAEDLLQETFVTLWRKRDQYRGEGAPLAYVRRIAYRTFLNSRSRIAARRPPLALDSVADVAAEPEENPVDDRDRRSYLRRRVEEALASLPDAAREAFLMFRFEGMRVAEIAEVTETPVKTVESRLKRAHGHLAERLEKYRDQLLPR